ERSPASQNTTAHDFPLPSRFAICSAANQFAAQEIPGTPMPIGMECRPLALPEHLLRFERDLDIAKSRHDPRRIIATRPARRNLPCVDETADRPGQRFLARHRLNGGGLAVAGLRVQL